ncbi:ribosomal protein S5 domain 2-like protein [Calocera cornea HHB12733]|uniref:Ribosomal protein S5 domain 2-like protein n=1 Tax=Calocera cornea HHB12733 TaxID=1353952 RepID=A0A165IR89_9BASI|nr:ribosomal protein S5 domain 2-like protein [Calocera cornea HHB12733]
MEAQRVQDAIDDAKIDDPSGETGAIASLPRRFWGNRGELHRYRVFQRRAVHQTGKGKMSSMAALYIIGNGQGLVGWGQGKHVDPVPAIHEAHRNGFLNLDLVDRFEDRTIWHETVFKFGATEVHLRPRPLGFGLRTGPIMHQVCKAAGIKDISGKIRGSKNKMNVVKATCLALWASQARPHMGDGIGGPGRRSEKGQGIRSRDDIERARGRSLREL